MKWLWVLIAAISWGVNAYVGRAFMSMEANNQAFVAFAGVLLLSCFSGFSTWKAMVTWFKEKETE